MKVYGMNINKKVSVMILFIFILCSSVALADASSDAFAQVFREASGSGNNVIERVVDALYYGLLIMYRGVSVKVSQLCGLFLVFFMTLDILTAILKNIAQVDLYSVFRTIIPKFVKNLIIAFILVTPTYYSLKIGVGGGATALKMKGTLVTQITEMFFDMFYRLGTLFFNDPGMARATPGRIAMAFFNRPLEMLKDIFGFMVFFAIFTNLAKVILLLFCLWLSGKIIAVYISNIFTALILTTFSIFYLMFLTMESTAQIGQKGIQMIVQQSVTLFMTVAMMGISYQVMNLVAAGNSIQAIAALAVVLLMLSQVMENIGMMANVGRPETDGNNAYGRTRAGVAFKKNAANARNMNDADSSMRNSAKKRHGMGVMSAKLFSAMVGGMTTSNLYDFDVLKGVGSEFKDVFSDKDFEGMGSNYPYSSKYYEDMRDNAKLMLGEAWDTAVGKLSKVNLGDSSGSEAVRQARLNAGNMIKAPKKVKVSNYDRK